MQGIDWGLGWPSLPGACWEVRLDAGVPAIHRKTSIGGPNRGQSRPQAQASEVSKSPLLVTKPPSLSLARADGTRVTIRLRRHPRAKRLKLSFVPARGFLLTMPERTPLVALEQALPHFSQWVEQVLARQANTAAVSLPSELTFAATQEYWTLAYGVERAATAQCEGPHIHIGAHAETAAAHQQLLRWFKVRATERLAPWVERLAEQHGFEVNAVSVGLARARWGSCSANKRIRLNAALLLIEAELVEHVLLHELAHTRHLNHSLAFWRCVGAVDPDYPRKHRALRLAWRSLPVWLWQAPDAASTG